MGRKLKRQYKYGYLNLAGPAGHQVEVVYDPSHCQQWAPAGSVPDDWFEHPKGVHDWLYLYYPFPASDCPKEKALEHSLQKWRGLRKEVLDEHGLWASTCQVEDAEGQRVLEINTESCALCLYYREGYLHCPNCPIAEVTRCCTGYSLPWRAWMGDRDPEPMIRALEAAVEGEKAKVEKKGFPRFFAPVTPDMATSRATVYIRIDGLHDPVRRVAPDGSESTHWWTLGNAMAAEASGGWREITEAEAKTLIKTREQSAREEREARARDIVSRLTAGEGPWVRVVNIPILGCTGMCLPNDKHAGQVGRFCGDAKDISCRVQFADADVAREGHNLEILTAEQAAEALWAARDAEGKE